MKKLERIERAILIFLVAALILGIAISALRKSHPPARVSIEKFDPAKYKTASGDTSTFTEKININYAGADELARIKGIGPKTAERIVEYRHQNGSFSSIDGIKNVKGVGAALFQKIRNRITVE